jgi:hypothetical protein
MIAAPRLNFMSNYRLFTLLEALTLLPTVRQLLIEIQEAKRELDATSAEVERLLGLTGGNGHLANDVTRARAEVQVSAAKLESLMSELDSIGVQLKGIEEGLVDFPCEREGRVILLCWRLGEETIAWWHDEDTGFPGRQPL